MEISSPREFSGARIETNGRAATGAYRKSSPREFSGARIETRLGND